MVAAAPLQGDLYQRADGAFDGWCFAPDRPDERLVVEVLVNDTVAVSMVAAMFRRDLLLRGCGDGYHGFLVRLPPNFPPAASECVITARERRSRRVFGRLLRPGPPPGTARLARLADEAAALVAALERLPARRGTAAPLRTALGALAEELGASRRVLWLPPVAAPRLTLALPVEDTATALWQIRALAPAAAEIGLEIVAVDRSGAAAALPALVRNLLYRRAPGDPAAVLEIAAEAGRGAWLALADAAEPSAAALLALANALPAAGRGVFINAALLPPAAGGDDAATLRLPAPLGFGLACDRGFWRDAGPLEGGAARAGAALALRAHLLGAPLWRVLEPVPRGIVRP
ncbi:MAG: hypothetical protein J0I21_11345 [Alphaproteobacteria bacterium]|nr:hypothetical protein [Alphaproteobacteria bacterium]